jgi:hypothetical protein
MMSSSMPIVAVEESRALSRRRRADTLSAIGRRRRSMPEVLPVALVQIGTRCSLHIATMRWICSTDVASIAADGT